MWNSSPLPANVVSFIGCDCDYDQARIILFGAPYDGTASFRPGSRFASQALRQESCGLETYSPYQERDLSDCQIMDSGDLELPWGDPAPALELIRHRTAKILADHKLPLLVGGEHLVTLGAVRAAAALYPELCIIHFDAHADLRDQYLGAKLSHACVLRRCWELVGDGRVFQFGIRSGEGEEFRWAQSHTRLQKFDFSGLAETVAQLRGKPVYLTVDLDVLDPSVLPGTGTPEAGGVSFDQLLSALLLVTAGCSVVGCDLTELAPELDPSHVSTAVAGKVLRELLLALSAGE